MAGGIEPWPHSSILRHQALQKGQVSLADDSETEIFDIGALSSQTVQVIESGYLKLTLNDQTNVDLTLYVDVNGSLEAIGGIKNFNSDGAIDVGNAFDVSTPVASSRVRLTATGSDAAPALAATVDYTMEHLSAE